MKTSLCSGRVVKLIGCWLCRKMSDCLRWVEPIRWLEAAGTRTVAIGWTDRRPGPSQCCWWEEVERQKQPEKYVKHFLPTTFFNGTPQHFGQYASSQTITLLYYQPVFHPSHYSIITEHYRKELFPKSMHSLELSTTPFIPNEVLLWHNFIHFEIYRATLIGLVANCFWSSSL